MYDYQFRSNLVKIKYLTDKEQILNDVFNIHA